MEVRNDRIERVLKSFGFSVALFLFWGLLTVLKARSLLGRFTPTECVWLFYNATISILFLVRTRPSIVSMNAVHWLVALVTCFSGFFFRRYEVEVAPVWSFIADGLIFGGLALGGIAALALGRSYDFLPALRGVQTGWVYQVVRHPMYLSSIVIRCGYLVRHFSAYNRAAFVVMVWLYDRRAAYEEQIMRNDARYCEYVQRVRFKFLPIVY